jgi:glycosyltransferase involved in cell wall biosynthesis
MNNKSISYKIVKLLSKLIYRKPDALTPISPGYVEILQSYGVDRKKIFVIMGGVDLEIFRNKNYIKRTNSKFRVIYSGSFSIAYDFDQVIKAAKILENEGSFEFILQGKGELESSMRSLIKDLNVLNVKIYSEVLSRNNLSRFLNTANALILPLRDFGVPYLGISTKLFEYQAVGKPIICCAYGQPAMYITETKSGLNVPPGNIEKLVEAIVELSKNNKMSENFGKAGILFVENNLSLNKIGSNIKQVFLNILEQNVRARKYACELINFM